MSKCFPRRQLSDALGVRMGCIFRMLIFLMLMLQNDNICIEKMEWDYFVFMLCCRNGPNYVTSWVLQLQQCCLCVVLCLTHDGRQFALYMMDFYSVDNRTAVIRFRNHPHAYSQPFTLLAGANLNELLFYINYIINSYKSANLKHLVCTCWIT